MNSKQTQQILVFLLVVVVITYLAGILSYREWKKSNPQGTVKEYFNGQNPTTKKIMVGMASGLIFGFIDNFGLFMGMSILDPLLKKLPGAGDANVFAGYGNTFSDMVGAFLGTFGGKYVADKFKEDEYPIWSEAVGIILGCLMGIAAGKAVKPK
jgi:hypothetical protein